jgi:phosphatidylserine/phosphatidylglycerophosphate/cardiolipin synthase-like enzyme
MPRMPVLLSVSLLCPLLLSCQESGAGRGGASAESLEVFFSPHGGCTDAVVQAYSFTSAPIAKAVVEARKRGVKVEAVLDKSNRTDKYSSATFLKNQACEVLIDARHAIAHNKIMIIDEQVIVTGSFNFARKAEESNAENLLIIRGCPKLVEKYLVNFREHQKHSESFAGADRSDVDQGKAENRGSRLKPPGTGARAN